MIEQPGRRENVRWCAKVDASMPAGGKNAGRKAPKLGPYYGPSKEAAELKRNNDLDECVHTPTKRAKGSGKEVASAEPQPTPEARPTRSAAPTLLAEQPLINSIKGRPTWSRTGVRVDTRRLGGFGYGSGSGVGEVRGGRANAWTGHARTRAVLVASSQRALHCLSSTLRCHRRSPPFTAVHRRCHRRSWPPLSPPLSPPFTAVVTAAVTGF